MAELKALAQRFYDEVITGGNIGAVDELVMEDFVEHEEGPPGLSNDRDGLKQFFTMLRAAFPDLSADVKSMAAEGDRVFVRVMFTGTHEGEWMGMPPTGKRVSVEAIDELRYEGERCAEHWGVTNMMSMMQQLGAIPEGAPTG